MNRKFFINILILSLFFLGLSSCAVSQDKSIEKKCFIGIFRYLVSGLPR
jgi:hypothetical protein